ncbi:hypothetical protein [Mycoplasma anserisalpingitidis]|nr:hypothetical protein [Mycoplasma anserisalpingitidis]UCU27419.1 hypothetical protein K9O38_03880 [Mycoplasma anserisalpingitidis]
MDTITQSVDEQIKFVINYVNTIINTHPMITENLKGEILYYINTALDLFLPYASKIVDTIKKSPDINIIEFIKTEENKESLKDILKKLCTIMFSRMKNNTDKYKKIIAEFLKAEHKESLINDFEEWLNNKESQAQFENEINKSLDQMFLVLEDLNANNLEKYEEILKKLTEFLNFNPILLGTRAINL